MKVFEEEHITVMEGACSPEEVIRDIVETGTQEDPFYVMDLGEVVARYRRWKELMPRVQPFYAVKCNDHKLLVSTLAALGAGFDCASKSEIELITSLGVKPERIIFANPAKMPSHICYASAVGVDCTTFDSEMELIKIKQYLPHAQLVIRIRCDAMWAQSPLGNKFGCDPITEAPNLLKMAAVLGLEVVGVSFHVGSGAMETAAYARGVALCRAMFGVGASVGHGRMRLVDIGGGFPGRRDTDICEVAQVINSALEEHFPSREVRVIAEPGRYFAAAPYTLAACVHSRREITKKLEVDTETHTMYFINDGVYGSFRDVVTLNEIPTTELLHPSSKASLSCSVWGPTCDSQDCVISATRLPPLCVGDWLLFRDMGAYTISTATNFNGFTVPKVRTFVDMKLWSVLKELYPLILIPSMKGERCMNSSTTPVTTKDSHDGIRIQELSVHPKPCMRKRNAQVKSSK